VRLNQLDSAGEVTETIAAVDDYELAEVVWRAAIERWPDATVILRQGARGEITASPPTCYTP
jgi:hypothetical protein